MNNEDRIGETERYYRKRAPEYEEVYHRTDPVRKKELARATDRMNEVIDGKHVLEVACGTGFWTEIASAAALDIIATDINTEMIDLAMQKEYHRGNVQFVVCDAYQLDSVRGEFDGGLANFWLSHVPKSRLDDFLRGFHDRLKPGSPVFMIDNMNTPGLGGDFVEEPGSEDTFKLRELKDGSTHVVIKNYFSFDDLRQLFDPYAQNLRIECETYYWWLSYSTQKA
jgi:ubiquinone/menaquinone biosynthesis C-methylase UbiE